MAVLRREWPHSGREGRRLWEKPWRREVRPAPDSERRWGLVKNKTSLNTRKFMVHILLKHGLENFEHYFTSV